MSIHCCNGCVPPKRTPTCKFDGTCNRYAEAKENHDRLKAEHDKEKSINIGIYADRSKKVYNALKEYRGNKHREK